MRNLLFIDIALTLICVLGGLGCAAELNVWAMGWSANGTKLDVNWETQGPNNFWILATEIWLDLPTIGSSVRTVQAITTLGPTGSACRAP